MLTKTKKMNAQEELRQFSALWDKSFVENNVAEISGFMSDDWIIIGSDGIKSKSDFLETIRSGLVTHSQMDADETHVRIYGDTGIIISKGRSAGTYDGQPFDLYEWSESVFVRRNGTWKCVSTMVTPIKTQ